MEDEAQSSSSAHATNSGAQPQSTEIVRNQGGQHKSAEAVTDNVAQPQSPLSVDSLSKVLGVTLIFLYVSGFLITSLHNFQYGFSEMNPLRPRILAAGGWFAIFIAVPFALVWELKKHSILKDKSNKLSRFATLVAAYMTSAIFLIYWTQGLFAFDDASEPVSGPFPPWWQIVLLLLGVLVALVVIVVVYAKLKTKLPAWATSALTLGFYCYILFAAYYQLFSKHSFKSNAMYFWVLITGGFIYFELSRRKWIFQAGQWDITILGFFFMMTIFATVYYPHIMAKWGGGALIPIELTFFKDAPVRSGVQVDCSLIDETDAGFYVIGRGEPYATFIPRTEISSIYYGQVNGHSLFTEGLPRQAPSSPQNSPLSIQPSTSQVTPSQQPVSAADQTHTAPASTAHPEPQARSK
jgi:hypothetical protein